MPDRVQVRSAGSTVLCALLPGSVAAHSPMPGIEGFYVGLVHPATEPAQLLVLLSAGLLLGLAGAAIARPAWAAFAATLAAGLVAGFASTIESAATWLALAIALVLALTSLAPFARWAIVVLVGAAGFAVGLGAMPEPGARAAMLVTLVGTFVGANLLLIFLFGLIDVLRERLPASWLLTGGRVVAAWLGAIAVMLLAFEFAPGP